jgi:hypothetical protein
VLVYLNFCLNYSILILILIQFPFFSSIAVFRAYFDSIFVLIIFSHLNKFIYFYLNLTLLSTDFNLCATHFNLKNVCILFEQYVNPLKMKRRLLYLKTQFVPRCKHFSSRL